MTFDYNYYERGISSGKSLYENYRWIPELTIPLAHHFIQIMNIKNSDTVLDFGCAKGYLVKAMCLLDVNAYGYDVSEYAISKAPVEIKDKITNKLSGYYNHIIAKDVLEHVEESDLNSLLKTFHIMTQKICIIVPLSEDQIRYNIEANELDKTHLIRRPLEWWTEQIKNAGFNIETSTHEVGVFKKGQEKIHPLGNGLIIGSI